MADANSINQTTVAFKQFGDVATQTIQGLIAQVKELGKNSAATQKNMDSLVKSLKPLTSLTPANSMGANNESMVGKLDEKKKDDGSTIFFAEWKKAHIKAENWKDVFDVFKSLKKNLVGGTVNESNKTGEVGPQKSFADFMGLGTGKAAGLAHEFSSLKDISAAATDILKIGIKIVALGLIPTRMIEWGFKTVASIVEFFSEKGFLSKFVPSKKVDVFIKTFDKFANAIQKLGTSALKASVAMAIVVGSIEGMVLIFGQLIEMFKKYWTPADKKFVLAAIGFMVGAMTALVAAVILMGKMGQNAIPGSIAMGIFVVGVAAVIAEFDWMCNIIEQHKDSWQSAIGALVLIFGSLLAAIFVIGQMAQGLSGAIEGIALALAIIFGIAIAVALVALSMLLMANAMDMMITTFKGLDWKSLFDIMKKIGAFVVFVGVIALDLAGFFAFFVLAGVGMTIFAFALMLLIAACMGISIISNQFVILKTSMKILMEAIKELDFKALIEGAIAIGVFAIALAFLAIAGPLALLGLLAISAGLVIFAGALGIVVLVLMALEKTFEDFANMFEKFFTNVFGAIFDGIVKTLSGIQGLIDGVVNDIKNLAGLDAKNIWDVSKAITELGVAMGAFAAGGAAGGLLTKFTSLFGAGDKTKDSLAFFTTISALSPGILMAAKSIQLLADSMNNLSNAMNAYDSSMVKKADMFSKIAEKIAASSEKINKSNAVAQSYTNLNNAKDNQSTGSNIVVVNTTNAVNNSTNRSGGSGGGSIERFSPERMIDYLRATSLRMV